MATLTCEFIKSEQCRADSKKNVWVDTTSSKTILSAKANSGDYSYITKISFITGSATNLYQSTKLVLQVRSKTTLSNPHYNASKAYLTTQDLYYTQEIFDIDPNYSSAYGPGSQLNSNYMASSPVCIDTSGTTTTDVKTTSNQICYFVFETKSLKPNSTYYIYFIRGTNIYNGYFEAELQSIQAEYTPYTQLSKPTISTNLGTIAPKEKITISWSKVTNASSYKIYLKAGSTTVLSEKNTTGTSYEATISAYDSHRGKDITAYVYAVGSGMYSNSETSNKVVAKFNTKPSAPTVSQSTQEINSSISAIFTVTAGSDTDGQTTSLYYSLNGENNKQLFTSPLTITISTQSGGSVQSGNNTIYFYTYDGLEYSPAQSKTFNAVFAPVIGSISTNYTPVENMNGNSSTLASKAEITFTMQNGTAKSVLLYVRTNSTTASFSGEGIEVPSGSYTYNSSTKTITIPITTIDSRYIPEGSYFQFAFKVSDGAAESNLSAWQTYKRRPKAPLLPTFRNYSNHADASKGATATDTFYKNYVTITLENHSADVGCAKTSSILIMATYNGITKEYSSYTESSKTVSVKLDLTQVNPGVSTSFKFKITDVAGQSKISDTVLTLTKTSNLVYGGSTVNVTNDNLKPKTNKSDFQIAHPVAQASGTPTIAYKYLMQIGTEEAEISSYSIVESTKDQIKISITASDINNIALNLVDEDKQNMAYSATIIVQAADGFATTATLSKVITVNFTEPPTFSTNTFDIKHDYLTGTGTITTSTGTKITSTSALNVRMVNSGEGIIFVLPKATDPNGDIAEYRIFLSRNDFYDTSSVLKYNEVTFGQTPWLIIPHSTLEDGVKDSNYYYYMFKASQYTKNEYFYFKLQARDETGNTSSEIICQNYIIGCRTVAPTFSAGNVKVEKNINDSTQSYKITLSYNFKITDLGGSAKSSGWDINYYKDYPNFERTISGYTPKASLVISISPNQSFTDKVFTSSPIEFTPGSGQQLLDFSSTQVIFSSDSFIKNSQSWNDFVEFASGNDKIFMKFTLTVSYGLQNTNVLANVVSAPQIYTYFGSVPTVAHRAHKVGINTTSLGQDDVLVVENYQGTKYVRFKGTDASNASKTYEITFDLLTGSITGAVIDCGSW